MKKIVIIFAFVILTLIILLSCSKIIESNSTACVILDLVFPETTTTDRDQIEVVTLRVSDNDTYDETFELEIENNIASGSIELEYGIYNFYVEAGFFEGEIFHLLYFGNVSNIDISESNNHVDIILVDAIAPTAGFSGTPTSGSAPLTVQFTDLSTPGSSSITEWLWDFADGSTSTSQNPSHIFTSNGNYTIELTVTTTVGSNTEETTNYINVTSNPIGPTADFSGTPTSGLAPLTVQFTDLSTAGTSPITEWLWDFADGSTSTSQNPSHIFTSNGNYTIELTVTTTVGSNTEETTNYINVTSNSIGPTAEFFGNPTSGDAPLTVQFTDLSTAGTSPITDWSWVFGDGNTSTSQNPSHIYTTVGDYSVALIVTTSVSSDEETKIQYINVIPVSPIAEFSGTPTAGHAPLSVQFTDESVAGSSSITSWSWNFGDGSTSTSQNPSHIYTAEGVYTVALTVTTSNGSDSETKPNYINVQSSVFIEVISPNGGENWALGSAHTITWDSANVGTQVYISIYLNNNYLWDIVSPTNPAPNTGSYNWDISNSLDESDFYKIKICSMNGIDFDYSDSYFSLYWNRGEIDTLSVKPTKTAE